MWQLQVSRVFPIQPGSSFICVSAVELEGEGWRLQDAEKWDEGCWVAGGRSQWGVKDEWLAEGDQQIWKVWPFCGGACGDCTLVPLIINTALAWSYGCIFAQPCDKVWLCIVLFIRDRKAPLSGRTERDLGSEGGGDRRWDCLVAFSCPSGGSSPGPVYWDQDTKNEDGWGP